MSQRTLPLAMLALLLTPPARAAEPPSLVGFQGRLTDAAGNPVTDTVTAVLTLYDAETGGSAVWTESRSVAVTGGLYSVLLGEGTALDPAAFDKPLWLGVAVNGDPEMTPRYRLAAAPCALMAKQAAGLQGRPVASSAPASGQVLKWDGAAWAPADDGGAVYTAGAGLSLSAGQFSIPAGGIAPGMLSLDLYAINVSGSAAGFTGSLAGDVTGTQSATAVVRLQGRSIAATAPATGHVLTWDGAAWAPAPDASTTYGAGDGLALAGTTFSAAYAGSGGDLGAALSLARSDHVHDGRYYTELEVDTALAGKLSLAGGTLAGPLGGTTASFSGTVSGADPTAAAHFVTKQYADATYLQSVTQITATTAVLNFPSVSNNSTADLTMDVAGVQAGDTVALGIPPFGDPPNGSVAVMPTGALVVAFVSGPGKVTVRYGIIGSGGGYDPPAATFRVTVFRY